MLLWTVGMLKVATMMTAVMMRMCELALHVAVETQTAGRELFIFYGSLKGW